MKNKGFTLVELSIVLVIIGLLVGGILVAQSMISTVKVQSLVKSFGLYEAGVANFKTTYKQYPGDSQYFVPPGNGDNRLFDVTGTGCAAAPHDSMSEYESEQFWGHMSQARMVDKEYVNYAPSAYCAGGTHDGGYFDAQYGGVLWPYVELSGSVVTSGNAEPKFPYYFQKDSAQEHLRFALFIMPEYVLPLESKLGFSTWSTQVVGLTKGPGQGAGDCYTTGFTNTKCTAPDASFGRIFYAFAPN